jgi:hypothetical protein
MIRNYFVEWTKEIEENQQKAYPDDRFPYGADWQMTDFMKRIGLKFPVGDNGSVDGKTFYLRITRIGNVG